MQLINLKSGSKEWKEFRRSHIGASDACCIMGTNPWKSITKLYEEKLFPCEEEDNFYMARGRDLEPVALEYFEEMTGLTLFPIVAKHDSIPYMIASLDGLTIDKRKAVEIKCPGKVDHGKALSGFVPEKYIPQLQHQMEVCNLDKIYYFSFDGEHGVLLEVCRDQSYIDILLEREKEFWHCLKTFKPPLTNSMRKEYAQSITSISGTI